MNKESRNAGRIRRVLDRIFGVSSIDRDFDQLNGLSDAQLVQEFDMLLAARQPTNRFRRLCMVMALRFAATVDKQNFPGPQGSCFPH